LSNICQKYIEGIIWISNYYFDNCPCWKWFYPYKISPFITDLYHFIKNKKLRTIKFPKHNPISIPLQLSIIIPPQLAFLTPLEIQNIIKTNNPSKFEIDYLYKRKAWQGVPILPFINIKKLENLIINVYNSTASSIS